VEEADLVYLGIDALRDGGVPSVRVVEAILERIGALDGADTATALRSVLSLAATALDEARAADRGERPGPLCGIPVLVKDSIEVAGLPSCAGSTALLERPARRDAPLVRRIREAGGVVVGTANLSEWSNIRSARSTSGWSAVGGLCGNPWALDRSPGGSSSGSGAALAAGLTVLAVGSETDGSITCPASLNGVVGIKPAVGAVPREGTVPVSTSQDSPGPMARTTDDAALLFEVLTGSSGVRDRARAGVEGLRVGVARTWRTSHPATDARVDEIVEHLRGAGATVTDVEAPGPDATVLADEFTVMLCELVDAMRAYLPTRGPDGPQDLAEVVGHEKAYAEVELAHFGHDFFEQALEMEGTGSDRYREARQRNLAWALETCLEPALAGVDVLVAPTYGPAWKSDLVLGGHPAAASPVTTAPSIAGWPIATAPMAPVEGLPVGLGAVGRPGSEPLLLAVCRTVEHPARPEWHAPVRG
jgi:amidase